jgi:hypothetical protein
MLGQLSRRLLARILAAAAAALVLAVASATDVLAGGTVSVGKPIADPSPNTVIVEGAQVTFRCSGAFRPFDEDEESWVGFSWDFGDGSVLRGGQYSGGGTKTDARSHTYLAAGDYVVRCTAFHGFTLTGFKFSKSRTLRIKVLCEGTATGPRSCGRGTFDSFSGLYSCPTFTQQFGREIIVDMTQTGSSVKGNLGYLGLSGSPVGITFDDRNIASGGGTIDSVLADAPGTHNRPGERPARVKLFLVNAEDSVEAYRKLVLSVEGSPDLRSDDRGTAVGWSGTLQLEYRDTVQRTSTICTTLSPKLRQVAPGGRLVFAVTAENQGLAGVPAERLVVEVTVENATLLAEGVATKRVVREEFDATTAFLTLGALGEGPGRRSAQAGAVVPVEVPANAVGEVTCRVRVLDGAIEDESTFAPRKYFVNLPPDRFVCVPIVRPPQPSAK